jgi:hypothetical protein
MGRAMHESQEGRKELNGKVQLPGMDLITNCFCVDVNKNKDSKFLFFLDVIICS